MRSKASEYVSKASLNAKTGKGHYAFTKPHVSIVGALSVHTNLALSEGEGFERHDGLWMY